MKRRPIELTIFAVVHLLIALSFYFQVAYFLSINPLMFLEIVGHLTWLNMSIMTLMVIMALLALRASSWVLYISPLSFALVAWNNYLVGHYSVYLGFSSSMLAVVGYFFVQLPLFFGRSMYLFFHPDQRWWITPRRFRVSLPIVINHLDNKIYCETFDLSRTGTFLADQKLLKMGQKVSIILRIPYIRDVNCLAKVVRSSNERGCYPGGVGLTFKNLGIRDKLALAFFIKGRSHGLSPHN